MSAYISDELLAKLAAFNPVTENAKRHEPDHDGYQCVRCNADLHTLSEYDPSPLCHQCMWAVFDALVKEVQTRRAERVEKAHAVVPPTQRNVRFRGGRR